MVTICVDGENKTHKITDWTLWAGNDDGEVMLTCHFRSGKKIYSSAFCMSDNANCKFAKCFPRKERGRCNIPG